MNIVNQHLMFLLFVVVVLSINLSSLDLGYDCRSKNIFFLKDQKHFLLVYILQKISDVPLSFLICGVCRVN